jgi:electron transfer flavoprotein beta subunit
VPDTGDIKIDPKTNTLMREGVPSIINPFDLHALEAGLQIRESFGGKVIVLTMGPPQAESSLREALSMGADEAVLLSDRAFAGADTWATSYTLAKAINKIGADIFLHIPHIAYVKKIEEVKEKHIRVQRLMDEGYDVVESSLPVLLTVVKELNNPRMPSLKGKMTAKKAEIKKMGMVEVEGEEDSVGLKGSPTQVKRIFAPELKTERMMIDGTPDEQVDTLVRELRKLKCL